MSSGGYHMGFSMNKHNTGERMIDYLVVGAAGASEVDDLDVGPLGVLEENVLRLEITVDDVHLL